MMTLFVLSWQERGGGDSSEPSLLLWCDRAWLLEAHCFSTEFSCVACVVNLRLTILGAINFLVQVYVSGIVRPTCGRIPSWGAVCCRSADPPSSRPRLRTGTIFICGTGTIAWQGNQQPTLCSGNSFWSDGVHCIDGIVTCTSSTRRNRKKIHRTGNTSTHLACLPYNASSNPHRQPFHPPSFAVLLCGLIITVSRMHAPVHCIRMYVY